MDNSKWAFAPDAPEWPVNARGEKEKAVSHGFRRVA